MRPTAAKTVWETTRRGIIGGMGAPAVASLDPSLRDALDVARDLGVDPATGLTMSDAEHRLQSDGPNELRAKPPVPLWRKILAQFQDPLIYLLLVAVAISVAAWLTQGAAGLPIDALVISAIVLLNGILGFVQERKAETAVAALQSMTAAMSTVLRDGELYTVPSTELVRGDILALSEGDAVGADGRLLSATALRVSEASLTGESESVTKNVATLPEPVPLGDRKNMVYRGTAVAQGVGRAVVTATGMGTEMGAIAEMLEATEEEPSPLQKEIARRQQAARHHGDRHRRGGHGRHRADQRRLHAQRRRHRPAARRLARRRGGAGGIAGHPVGRAGHRRAAHGPAQCRRQAAALGGDARLGHRSSRRTRPAR